VMIQGDISAISPVVIPGMIRVADRETETRKAPAVTGRAKGPAGIAEN